MLIRAVHQTSGSIAMVSRRWCRWGFPATVKEVMPTGGPVNLPRSIDPLCGIV
jgi:hypothetical protein